MPKKGYTPPDFLIYVLSCTAHTTKSKKTNDIPLESPIKLQLQEEMQKMFLNFPKFVRFSGHFLKKRCFRKMGVAAIKQLPPPSKIGLFSSNLNGESLLKVSFKNIDGFQKYKSKIVKKAQFHEENGVKKQFSTSKLSGMGCTAQNVNQEIRGCKLRFWQKNSSNC